MVVQMVGYKMVWSKKKMVGYEMVWFRGAGVTHQVGYSLVTPKWVARRFGGLLLGYS